MAEQNALTAKPAAADKPKGNIFSGALRMVKGDNTTQLMENFTSEMTLVAEGLCEDQSKLRREVERAATEQDRRIQRLESKIDMVDTSMDEERRSYDQVVTELRNRLATLEKKADAKEKEPRTKEKKKTGTIIRELTWLVAIAAGAWVIVTVINKFF